MTATTETKRSEMVIENGFHISANTGGIYETTKREVEPDAMHAPNIRTSFPWAKWGHDDNYPQRLIDAVMADPAAALLEKNVLCIGAKV